VKAIDGEGRTASSAWVWQEDGSFELRGLVPGPYTVRAQQGIGPQASGAVAGVAAGTTGLEIPLGP
jgi:hypothetical protein